MKKNQAQTESAQAMLCALITILLGSLVLVAISRAVLWKIDTTRALSEQVKLIEEWQVERPKLISASHSALTFKKLGTGNHQLAIPVIPKKFSKADSLRIPVFLVGGLEHPKFNWNSFITSTPGGCGQIQEQKCSKLLFSGNKSNFLGDAELQSLDTTAGHWIIAVTGALTINQLKIKQGSQVEIISGFDLKIQNLEMETDSSLFINSVYGATKFPSLASLDCSPSLNVRVSSKNPIQLKSKTIASTGCGSIKPSKFWQELRYVGEIPQKSIN